MKTYISKRPAERVQRLILVHDAIGFSVVNVVVGALVKSGFLGLAGVRVGLLRRTAAWASERAVSRLSELSVLNRRNMDARRMVEPSTAASDLALEMLEGPDGGDDLLADAAEVNIFEGIFVEQVLHKLSKFLDFRFKISSTQASCIAICICICACIISTRPLIDVLFVCTTAIALCFCFVCTSLFTAVVIFFIFVSLDFPESIRSRDSSRVQTF